MKRKCLYLFLKILFLIPSLSISQTFVDVSSAAGTAFNHDGVPMGEDMQMGTGAAWFDYNKDGLLDFYVTNRKTANKLFKNNGNGTFSEVAASMGVENTVGDGGGVVIGDINNDGWPDIYLANSNEDVLYKNNN